MEGQNVGVKSVEVSDPLVPISAFNALSRVRVDPSGVWEFKTLEVWSGVIE
jgi:hypothetical protein